jgi:hypothetical protein
MTIPLRNLFKKDVVFRLEAEQENAFQKIKTVITQQPAQILAYFNPNAAKMVSVVYYCKMKKPVSFASKSLTDAEGNYAQITKVLYAVLFGLKKVSPNDLWTTCDSSK